MQLSQWASGYCNGFAHHRSRVQEPIGTVLSTELPTGYHHIRISWAFAGVCGRLGKISRSGLTQDINMGSLHSTTAASLHITLLMNYYKINDHIIKNSHLGTGEHTAKSKLSTMHVPVQNTPAKYCSPGKSVFWACSAGRCANTNQPTCSDYCWMVQSEAWISHSTTSSSEFLSQITMLLFPLKHLYNLKVKLDNESWVKDWEIIGKRTAKVVLLMALFFVLFGHRKVRPFDSRRSWMSLWSFLWSYYKTH